MELTDKYVIKVYQRCKFFKDIFHGLTVFFQYIDNKLSDKSQNFILRDLYNEIQFVFDSKYRLHDDIKSKRRWMGLAFF